MATYQSSHTGAEIDAAVDAVAEKLPLTGGTLTGALILTNGTSIEMKDSQGNSRRVLFVSDSNNLNIGYDMPNVSGSTIVYGNTSTIFRIGGQTSDSNVLLLNGSSVTVEKLLKAEGALRASGDIIMAPSANSIGADSQKIIFKTSTATDGNFSPYIQAIYTGAYGRKRLSVFQVDASSYTGTYSEVFTILPNGRVGIGTTSPSTLLDVNGNASISGTLTLGGNAIVSVLSGSSAPSSSTGSDGDIYIQTS